MLAGTFEHNFKTCGVKKIDLWISPGDILKIKVSETGNLVLVTPRGTSKSVIHEFLDSGNVATFLSKALPPAHLPDLRAESEIWNSDKVEIPLFGSPMLCAIKKSKHVKFDVSSDGELTLFTGGFSPRVALGKACSNLVIQQTEKILTKLEKSGGPSGCTKVSSGMWGARWGQCSSDKVISIDWRAVFLPKDLFEHLVCHEACHLVHMNHSHHFKALLRSLRPNMEVEARKLRHGRNLIPLV